MRAQLADRRDRPEPFHVHPVGQLHDQGPAVIERAAFVLLVLPELVTSVRHGMGQVGRRVPCLLQQRDIDLAPARHLGQLAPRRPFLEDVPAHDPDHSAMPLRADGGALCTAGMLAAR